MALLLFSRSGAVKEKWSAVLKGRWQVHQASTYQEMLILLKRLPITTLLLHHQGLNGEELNEVCRQRGQIRVIVFSDRPDNRQGLSYLQLGCVGYAHTYLAPSRLIAALEAVESGLAWVGSSLMQYLIKGLAAKEGQPLQEHPSSPLPRLAELSSREEQIATLVGEGLTNQEIADRFAITERTVKSHLSSIYAKTGCKSRLSLALMVKER
jgi:two-component system, NarL family, nitrate/nitrite response regulator NarL